MLLPATALAGALFLLLADLAARTAAAPVELPLGIVTALAGATTSTTSAPGSSDRAATPVLRSVPLITANRNWLSGPVSGHPSGRWSCSSAASRVAAI